MRVRTVLIKQERGNQSVLIIALNSLSTDLAWCEDDHHSVRMGTQSISLTSFKGG